MALGSKIGQLLTGELIGALGDLPMFLGGKSVNKGSIVSETDDTFKVMPEDFKDFDFENSNIVPEDVIVEVPKSNVEGFKGLNFDDTFSETYSLKDMVKDQGDEDSVNFFISSMKQSGDIAPDASADDIFDAAEKIANSGNENLEQVGSYLMSPKSQSIYADKDRSVFLGERPQPITLNNFLKTLPDDFEITASNISKEINKISDDDAKFYLLRELEEKYPSKQRTE